MLLLGCYMDNPISKIEAADDGRIRVFPKTINSIFEYVYRAAAGVYWNKELQCFQSSNPNNWDNWDHKDWFIQILSAVKSELGEKLVLTNDTIFEKNVIEFEDEFRETYSNYRTKSAKK